MKQEMDYCPRCKGIMCADYELLYGCFEVCISCGYRKYPDFKEELRNILLTTNHIGSNGITANKVKTVLNRIDLPQKHISKDKSRSKKVYGEFSTSAK